MAARGVHSAVAHTAAQSQHGVEIFLPRVGVRRWQPGARHATEKAIAVPRSCLARVAAVDQAESSVLSPVSNLSGAGVIELATATPKEVLWKFIVPEYVTRFGEVLKVAGSLPELGQWDLNKAPIMSWEPGHRWVMEQILPIGADFEFKVVAMLHGDVRWEQGINRVIQASNSVTDAPVELVISLTCKFGLTAETGMELALKRSSVQESYELASATLELLERRRERLARLVDEEVGNGVSKAEVAQLDAAMSSQAQALAELGTLVAAAKLSEDGENLVLNMEGGKIALPKEVQSLGWSQQHKAVVQALAPPGAPADTGAPLDDVPELDVDSLAGSIAAAAYESLNPQRLYRRRKRAAEAAARQAAAAQSSSTDSAGNAPPPPASPVASENGGAVSLGPVEESAPEPVPPEVVVPAPVEVTAGADVAAVSEAAGDSEARSEVAAHATSDVAVTAVQATAEVAVEAAEKQQEEVVPVQEPVPEVPAAVTAEQQTAAVESVVVQQSPFEEVLAVGAVAEAAPPTADDQTQAEPVQGFDVATQEPAVVTAATQDEVAAAVAAAPAVVQEDMPVTSEPQPQSTPAEEPAVAVASQALDAPVVESVVTATGATVLPAPKKTNGGALFFSEALLAMISLPKFRPAPRKPTPRPANPPPPPPPAPVRPFSSERLQSLSAVTKTTESEAAEVALELARLSRNITAELTNVVGKSDAGQDVATWQRLEGMVVQAQALQEELVGKAGVSAGQEEEMKSLQELIRFAKSKLAANGTVPHAAKTDRSSVVTNDAEAPATERSLVRS